MGDVKRDVEGIEFVRQTDVHERLGGAGRRLVDPEGDPERCIPARGEDHRAWSGVLIDVSGATDCFDGYETTR
jgi:hypothetical protein